MHVTHAKLQIPVALAEIHASQAKVCGTGKSTCGACKSACAAVSIKQYRQTLMLPTSPDSQEHYMFNK